MRGGLVWSFDVDVWDLLILAWLGSWLSLGGVFGLGGCDGEVAEIG